MFTIEVMEGASDGPFHIGETDDMLEATFLARDDVCESAATTVAYVKCGDEIVYVIERFGESGYVSRRDGRKVTTLDEALRLLRGGSR